MHTGGATCPESVGRRPSRHWRPGHLAPPGRAARPLSSLGPATPCAMPKRVQCCCPPARAPLCPLASDTYHQGPHTPALRPTGTPLLSPTSDNASARITRRLPPRSPSDPRASLNSSCSFHQTQRHLPRNPPRRPSVLSVAPLCRGQALFTQTSGNLCAQPARLAPPPFQGHWSTGTSGTDFGRHSDTLGASPT